MMAVIGPEPLVKEICHIAAEFEEIEIKPLIYEIAEQSALLVKNCHEPIDIFVFAGPVPYLTSQDELPANSLSYYVPFEGSDIYRLLLQVYEQHGFYPVISFDVVSARYLQEAYEELGISHIPYFLKEVEKTDESEMITAHHLSLLKKEDIQVIATTLNSVFEQLKAFCAPALLIKHTKTTIRETLHKALLSGKQKKQEDAQITVLQFQLNESIEKQPAGLNDFKEIKEKISEYGKRLFSSSVLTEDNQFTLFTTRGVFEKVTKQRNEFWFLTELNNIFSVGVNLGIGIGETADSAVYNAKSALAFSLKKQKGSCFLIDEQKRIFGPLGTERSIDYGLANSHDNQTSLTLLVL